MQLMTKGLQKENQAMRERLRVLANHHNQAEIARRTGVSKANVHRYMRSGRAPGHWLQVLIRELGVNPAWLMLGRGEVLQSDVSEQAAQESAQLLELAVKLNAIGHEHLAAVHSRERTKMVRELSDTLARHDELRARVRVRVNPVFLKLLNEYRELIAQQRFEETEDILPALRQLERLGDNPRMRTNVDMLEAVQRHFEGDLPRQRRLHLNALAAMIADERVRDAQFMRLTFNTAAGMAAAGRYREAARLANSVLLLADADPPRWDEDWLLRVPAASLDLQDANPARGLAELIRVAAACNPSLAAGIQDMLLHAAFLTGAMTLAEVLGRGSDIPSTTSMMLLMALWDGNVAALRRLRASRAKLKGQLDARSARLVAATDSILSGGLPTETSGTTPLQAFEDAVLRCEAARITGKTRAAVASFRAATGALAAMEASTMPEFLMRALHARQTFEYGDKQQAAQFVLERLRQGYGCLRLLALQHGLHAAERGEVISRKKSAAPAGGM